MYMFRLPPPPSVHCLFISLICKVKCLTLLAKFLGFFLLATFKYVLKKIIFGKLFNIFFADYKFVELINASIFFFTVHPLREWVAWKRHFGDRDRRGFKKGGGGEGGGHWLRFSSLAVYLGPKRKEEKEFNKTGSAWNFVVGARCTVLYAYTTYS